MEEKSGLGEGSGGEVRLRRGEWRRSPAEGREVEEKSGLGEGSGELRLRVVEEKSG